MITDAIAPSEAVEATHRSTRPPLSATDPSVPDGGGRQGRRGRRVRAVAGVVVPPAIAFFALLVAWQMLADRNPYLLPKLADVASTLVEDPSFFVRNGRTTAGEAMYGLALGFGTAVVLSVLMLQIPVVQRAVLPLAVVLNVTPVVAIAPALVVAFGFGALPKVLVTAIITFFPALINVSAGLRSADPKTLEIFQTLRASRGEVLRKLQIPSALPFVFAAARVCLPLSLIGAVVGEFVAPGSTAGLGNVITVASANSQLAMVYAAIFCLALMGVTLSLLIAFVERRVLGRLGTRPRGR